MNMYISYIYTWCLFSLYNRLPDAFSISFPGIKIVFENHAIFRVWTFIVIRMGKEYLSTFKSLKAKEKAKSIHIIEKTRPAVRHTFERLITFVWIFLCVLFLWVCFFFIFHTFECRWIFFSHPYNYKSPNTKNYMFFENYFYLIFVLKDLNCHAII